MLTRTLSNWREVQDAISRESGNQGDSQKLDASGVQRASQIATQRDKMYSVKRKLRTKLEAGASPEARQDLSDEFAHEQAELARLRAAHKREKLIAGIIKTRLAILHMSKRPGYTLGPRQQKSGSSKAK